MSENTHFVYYTLFANLARVMTRLMYKQSLFPHHLALLHKLQDIDLIPTHIIRYHSKKCDPD